MVERIYQRAKSQVQNERLNEQEKMRVMIENIVMM